MGFSTRRHWLVTTALASTPLLFSVSMAHAACSPDPASNGAAVVCSGTDADGFNSSANELDITVEEGATVDSPGDRAFNLSGTGNSLTNNGDIVGSVRGYYSSTFSSIVNNGSITAFASERAAIYSYSGLQNVFVENNGDIILNGSTTAIFGWGQATITNNGIISGNDPNAQGISVDLFNPFTPNTIINNGTIDVGGLALNVGGSVTIQNTGALTDVLLDGFSITPKPYAIEMTNHASGFIHGSVYGERSVSLSNAGVIDGDVMLSGLYRSIGGTLSGNLSFGFGHDTFLVSLDFEGAPLGVSGIIDPGWGRDAAGYTTTGVKSVSYGLFSGFEVVAAEADGEDARLTITSDKTENGSIRLFGTGTIINEVNFAHPDDIGLLNVPNDEIVIDIWGPYTHFENHASIISGTGIYGRFGAGSILNAGTISSIYLGISSERASGVVVRNSGTIEVTGAWGHGIYLSEFWSNYQQLAPEGNADTIVENTGVITSDFTGAIYIGQVTASAQVSVLNSGSITTDGVAVKAVDIFAWGNVRVENSGVISTTGADSTVLLIDSDDSVIINTGTLQSQGAGANVIFAESADSTIIQNSGMISLLGGGSRTVSDCNWFVCINPGRIPVDHLTEAAAAITIQASEGIITNEAGGIIEAAGEGSTAILVDVSLASQTTIVNAGIIRGPEDSVIITDEGDIHLAGAIQGSDAVEVIDNSGVIIGNIDLAGRDDRFILRDLGTVDGDTQGGDDVDTLVVDTSVNTGVDLSRFLSFEAFEKRGNGATELNGDAAFDSVEILGGSLAFGQGSHIVIPALEVTEGVTLTVNGGLATNLTVDANGALDGSGAIDGDVANNGAISPGNSPGTLTVGGDYAQGAGGSLTIEIVQSASPLNPTAGVDYDRLAVEGAAALDGTLLFDIAPAIYANGAAYDVITAVDGITGDFATVSGLPTQGFVSFSGTIISNPAVSANADNVYRWTVSRRAYASAALTPNETATATAFTAALGSAYAAPASDTASVLMALDAMSDADASSLFEAANGEAYGSFLTAGQDMSDLFLRTLQSRARSGLAGGWLEGYSAWGNGDGDGNAAGADISLAGAGAGLDMAIGDHALAGVAFGYGSANVDSVRNAATGDGNAWQAALYARLRWQETTFSGVLGYGEIDFDGTRAIVVSPLSRLATANAKTKALYFAAEASRQIRTARVGVEPFLGLTNTHVKLGGFSESGAGALSLDLEGVTATSTRVYVGAEISLARESSLLPWLRASYSHQVSNNNRHIAQSFSESGVAFVSDGRAPSDDAVAVAAGITWEAAEGVVLTVGYDGLFRGDINYHGATGRLQFIF